MCQADVVRILRCGTVVQAVALLVALATVLSSRPDLLVVVLAVATVWIFRKAPRLEHELPIVVMGWLAFWGVMLVVADICSPALALPVAVIALGGYYASTAWHAVTAHAPTHA